MRSSRVAVVAVVLLAACSGGTKSVGGIGAGGGGSGNGTGSGGSANGTGNGGSANGTGSGGSANGTGNGGSANGTGSSFCIIGFKGCTCDGAGQCASGLTCTNGTCCDTASGNCSAPIPTGGGDCTAAGGGGPVTAGGSGGGSCVPGTSGLVLTDCGYPYASNNPRTSVTFNESEVLRGIQPSGGTPIASIRLFYNDEHALTLGVQSVNVKTTSGTTTTNYPVTPLVTDPDTASYPDTGTNAVSGDQAGLDPSGRPMWPALFITDTTVDPNDRSGDWQQCGTPYNPNVIFGTWKGAVRNVDTTVTPNTAAITPDIDPAKNNWNLGGGDPVPSTLTTNQGYGAEVRWDLVLIPGHSYRIQVMVHDGDQNKAGGDSGEACVNFCAENSCPQGSSTCDSTAACPSGAVCAGGCCLLPG